MTSDDKLLHRVAALTFIGKRTPHERAREIIALVQAHERNRIREELLSDKAVIAAERTHTNLPYATTGRRMIAALKSALSAIGLTEDGGADG